MGPLSQSCARGGGQAAAGDGLHPGSALVGAAAREDVTQLPAGLVTSPAGGLRHRSLPRGLLLKAARDPAADFLRSERGKAEEDKNQCL